jgi:hypothetical protein
VRRLRGLVAVASVLLALALVLAACGGGDQEETTTSPAPSPGVAPPGGDGTPSPGALPPALVQCFADRGFPLESPTEIHSAPPQVVQACFGLLHQGGGAP